MDNTRGYIHLYTGNGKGKTTAALGLAIRALGAGKTVVIAQFVKGMHYSELNILRKLNGIEVHQFGLDCFIVNEPTAEDRLAALRGLEFVTGIIRNGSCDILILDEVCIAIHYKLFETERIIDLLKTKPFEMEIVLTGRYASTILTAAA
ncbi:MAG: cob(I)yrinic acid a,c-diamide adenosyltransferase, partial [Bacteroidales bacterium]|nr:cob(I)yrinic acid a,c-diamide adenosyltransferase [Bacteroidales bacterium]